MKNSDYLTAPDLFSTLLILFMIVAGSFLLGEVYDQHCVYQQAISGHLTVHGRKFTTYGVN